MTHTASRSRPFLTRAQLFSLALLSALLLLVLLSGAHAQTAGGDLDTALNPAANQICKNLDAIANSAFVSVIAIAMFVAGGIMIWLKVRGGIALAAFGLIGFFLVKKLVPIAQSMGIVPKGISCTAGGS